MIYWFIFKDYMKDLLEHAPIKDAIQLKPHLNASRSLEVSGDNTVCASDWFLPGDAEEIVQRGAELLHTGLFCT
jgi:hypothetical protein